MASLVLGFDSWLEVSDTEICPYGLGFGVVFMHEIAKQKESKFVTDSSQDAAGLTETLWKPSASRTKKRRKLRSLKLFESCIPVILWKFLPSYDFPHISLRKRRTGSHAVNVDFSRIPR